MVFANNYTIFYYVFDKENIVKVVKVAYSKMDLDKILKKFDEEESSIWQRELIKNKCI